VRPPWDSKLIWEFLIGLLSEHVESAENGQKSGNYERLVAEHIQLKAA
jgi:hypothetical protein